MSARRDDAQARRRAQEFDRPLVVEAGAGTGKTTTLVARIVVWCLGPGWERAAGALGPDAAPERVAGRVLGRVVAITFTEAATAEMSRRVGEALRELARGELPRGVAEEGLPSEPARAARAALLLRALDLLGVRTIHAFCRRLLAEHALEAGLHPRFAVDADESRQEALVRRVVEESLGELFSGEAGRVLARAGHGPREIADALLQLVRDGVPETSWDAEPLGAAEREALRGDVAASAAAFLDSGGRDLLAAPRATKLIENVQRVIDLLAWLPAEGGLGTEALAELRARAVAIPRDELAAWAKGNFRKGGLKLLGERAGAVQAAGAELRAVLRNAAALDPDLLRAAWELLGGLHRRVARSLRAEGVETFAGLLADARDLLEGRPEVARRVRDQIDQLLVDEFQDTDAVQCAILERLVLDAPEDQRPRLFLVGDPKQSIYGWRNADLAAYERFRDRVLAVGGEVLQLVVNHRSVPAILAEVERLVEPVMQAEPGVQPPFRSLEPAPDREADPGWDAAPRAPVEHWVSWAWDEAGGGAPPPTRRDAARIEARALADDVAALHGAGVAWKEIGLLFRSGTDWETYLEALRRRGVPFAVEGDRSYFERREVLDAAAWLRCVLDPNDQLALAAWLRSPAVGVPDAALVPLWSRDVPHRLQGLVGEPDVGEWRALIAAAAADVPDDVPGIERVAGWTDTLLAGVRALGRLREAFEREPGDVFVERLRESLLVEAGEASRYLGAYRVANLDRMFRDLLASFARGDADPQAIVRTLRQDVAERRAHEEGRPREAVEDAVQIMTIHKAKGLDFEHVYLLQVHKGHGNRGEDRATLENGRLELHLLGGDVRTPTWHRAERRRQRVEAAELRRTWYVALTRARRRLVVAGCWPAPGRSGDGYAPLLRRRGGGAPDLAEAMADCAASGARLDHAGARFGFPGMPAFAPPDVPPAAADADSLPSLDAVRERARELADARRAAAVRMARPRSEAISAAAHEAGREARRDGGAGEDEGAAPLRSLPREAAQLVGIAVHRALECWDLEADPAAELARGWAGVEAELAAGLAPAEREAALARAGSLLERFAAGPLLLRLRALGPHVAARELPVLLPPDGEDDAPVGFRPGVIDLLYRDPESGGWVVADYKTDRAGEGDLDALCARYAAQGRGYVRAVREALGLDADPRFELWFLDAEAVRSAAS